MPLYYTCRGNAVQLKQNETVCSTTRSMRKLTPMVTANSRTLLHMSSQPLYAYHSITTISCQHRLSGKLREKDISIIASMATGFPLHCGLRSLGAHKRSMRYITLMPTNVRCKQRTLKTNLCCIPFYVLCHF